MGKELSRPKKYLTLFILLLGFLAFCSQEHSRIQRVIENGVEVVINRMEPYAVKGEPASLYLVEEFTIDIARGDIAELGLTDIGHFDIDSHGNIYFLQRRESDTDVIYAFDKNGRFQKTIGKRGQGPGEIQLPVLLYITGNDEIPVQDMNTHKLYVFDSEGRLKRETRIESEEIYGGFVFYPLVNGNYLKYGEYFDPESQHRQNILQLLNSRFEMIDELDRCDHGKVVAFAQQKKVFTPRVFIGQVSNGKIFVGHEKRGYEILVYDLDGRLLRKIRKEYAPVDVPEAFKENWRANIGRYENRLVFPDKMPPYHYFFLDDDGRLFVKTYERGPNAAGYMHDIFNSDGLFVMRISMPGYGNWIYPGDSLNKAKAKNGRFYCIREKESGFKELAVYRMTWE